MRMGGIGHGWIDCVMGEVCHYLVLLLEGLSPNTVIMPVAKVGRGSTIDPLEVGFPWVRVANSAIAVDFGTNFVAVRQAHTHGN